MRHILHGYVATVGTTIAHEPRVGYSSVSEPNEDRSAHVV